MRVRHCIVGSALIILAGCQHSFAPDSLPTLTRTGEVKDVVIQDTISPGSVVARPGDEIRWINKRQTDVQVTVLSPAREELTCQRNFRGMMGVDHHEYTANVERNDTAGVCFRHPTELQYVVRTEPSDAGGEPYFVGTVVIGPEEQRWPSMEAPDTASLAHEEPS
jgi:hypothetical protein